MKKDFSLLLIGFFDSVYFIQFVKNIKSKCPDAHLFYWGYKPSANVNDEVYLDCFDEYSFVDVIHKRRNIILRKIESVLQFRSQFRAFTLHKKFDCVNIHFVRPEYFFIQNYLRKCSSKIMLTPWGSDVYRIDKKSIFLLKKLYASADYITGGNDRFVQDIIRKFNVDRNKILNYCLGADIIDYISDHKSIIDVFEAKKQMGLEGNYVITCGYNALQEQQHEIIIDSIISIKDSLPPNLLLLFPFTYPQNPPYIKVIKEKVRRSGLKALFVERFLNLSDLFLIRQATDMFVHIQTTDAGSTSVREYILCEKNVINGSWLKYPELGRANHYPYYEVDNLANLGQIILKAYLSGPLPVEKETLDVIEQRKWGNAIDNWVLFFSNLSV